MAPRPLSNAELLARLADNDTLGQEACLKKWGVNGSAWRSSIATARKLNKGTKVEEVDRLQTKVKNLESELKAIERDNVTAQEVRTKIFGIRDMAPTIPKWMHEPPKGNSSGVPLADWSDFHWGEVVRPDEVGGVNEFNREIAKKRVKLLAETTIDLAYNHMTHPNYPGIVVILGGDMLSGDIHEELRETNEAPVNVCLLECFEHTAAGLRLLADKFGNVFVVGVVGNHPRQSNKPRAKLRVTTNYDWLMYMMLIREFQDDVRFKFLVPDEPDAHFAIYGRRFMTTHGDSIGVKGGDGIIGMLGPITRGAVKVGRSEARIGRDFEYLVIHHWHTYVPKSDASAVIVNGTLKGYDEYAHTMLRAPYAPATQYLGFVHPKWGLTCQWPVRLDVHRSTAERRDAKWISWETRA